MAHGQGGAEIRTDGGAPIAAYPLLEVGKRTGVSTTDPRAGLGIGNDNDPMYTLQAGAQHGVAIGFNSNARADQLKPDPHTSAPLKCSQYSAVCFNPNQPQAWRAYSPEGLAPSLQSSEARGNAILSSMVVRRLTPRECERLQGFPDDYTLIPYRGKPAGQCPDGPRYKALGNSWAVPVVRWIGERINAVEQIRRERKAA